MTGEDMLNRFISIASYLFNPAFRHSGHFRLPVVITFFALIISIGFPLLAIERPEAAVAPLGLFGSAQKAQEKIIYNRFENLLSNYYRLLSKSQFKKARDVVFDTIQSDQCTEKYCIRKIQETLQVERLFFLDITKTDNLTQLTVTLIRIKDTLLEEDICRDCTIEKLYYKTGELVRKIVVKDLGAKAILNQHPETMGETSGSQEIQEPSIFSRLSGWEIGLHASLIAISAASIYQSTYLAGQYNDILAENNRLKTQSATTYSESDYSALKEQFENNQAEMSRLKQQILVYDVLSLASIIWEAVLITKIYTSHPDMPQTASLITHPHGMQIVTGSESKYATVRISFHFNW